MDVFKCRDAVIDDYKSFTTSFTKIKAEDIRDFVSANYNGGRFWPAPLVQLNSSYVRGGTVEELVNTITLHPESANIFRFGRDQSGNPGISVPPYLHKQQAIGLTQKKTAMSNYRFTTTTPPPGPMQAIPSLRGTLDPSLDDRLLLKNRF